jgi:hypothetical protein
LFCRTKYDADILNSPDFEKGSLNPEDYLLVDNWPFIITYFADKTAPPSDKDNLRNSLRIFVDSTKQESSRGYAMGFQAYEVWRKDMLDEAWYKNNDDEQLARRFSVNQFCSLALFDARKSAYSYLSEIRKLLPDKVDDMEQIIRLFSEISEKAKQIHMLLDSGEYLEGAKARRFWTKEMRETQAGFLSEILILEQKAVGIAERII